MGRTGIMSDEEIEELVATAPEWSGKPFVSTVEIAEQIGITRQGAHRRLVKLAENDQISRYVVGDQSAIHWCEETAAAMRPD